MWCEKKEKSCGGFHYSVELSVVMSLKIALGTCSLVPLGSAAEGWGPCCVNAVGMLCNILCKFCGDAVDHSVQILWGCTHHQHTWIPHFCYGNHVRCHTGLRRMLCKCCGDSLLR